MAAVMVLGDDGFAGWHTSLQLSQIGDRSDTQCPSRQHHQHRRGGWLARTDFRAPFLKPSPYRRGLFSARVNERYNAAAHSSELGGRLAQCAAAVSRGH